MSSAIMLVGDHAANHRRDCMYAFSNHQFSRWIRASGRRAQKNCLRRRVLTEKCFCEYVVNQAMRLRIWVALLACVFLA